MRSSFPAPSFLLPALCVLALAVPVRGADSLAFLHNGSDEALRIHRLPSFASQDTDRPEPEGKGIVMGWVDACATPSALEPNISEAQGAVLSVPPGGAVGFAWIDRDGTSSRTHLRILVGEGGDRRCFMTYRVEGQGAQEKGHLEPYAHFGPRIRLGTTVLENREVPSFLGLEASEEIRAATGSVGLEAWPELDAGEGSAAEAARLEVKAGLPGRAQEGHPEAAEEKKHPLDWAPKAKYRSLAGGAAADRNL